MNVNESPKSDTDDKSGKPLYTLLVVSLIAAFMLAALPMSSAFAAPAGPDEDEWDRKTARLMAEMAISSNLQTQSGSVCPSPEQARYRDQYIATLRAAQGVMVRGSNVAIPVTGNTADDTSDSNAASVGKYYANNPEKLLASYLHRLRQLREKMATGSDNSGNNNLANGTCIVTGTGTGTDTGIGTGTGTGTGTTTPATTPTTTPAP
jgi:hypothetical protein